MTDKLFETSKFEGAIYDDRLIVVCDLAVDAPYSGRSLRGLLEQFSSCSISRQQAQSIIGKIARQTIIARIAKGITIDIIVPVSRAGLAMWPKANELLGYPPTSIVVASRWKEGGGLDVHVGGGLDEHQHVLILDTIIATGSTIGAVVERLSINHPNRRYHVASCYASKEGLARILANPLVETVSTGLLSTGLSEDGFLIPFIRGDAGNKLFG